MESQGHLLVKAKRKRELEKRLDGSWEGRGLAGWRREMVQQKM